MISDERSLHQWPQNLWFVYLPLIPFFTLTMITTTTNAAAILLSFTLLYLVSRYLSTNTSERVPPGPKPLPLVGNVYDLTMEGELWLRATQWSKKFGRPSKCVLSKGMLLIGRYFRQPRLSPCLRPIGYISEQ